MNGNQPIPPASRKAACGPRLLCVVGSQIVERVPELWELAVRLDVLTCYPVATDAWRQRRHDAIGSQMVGVTLEHIGQEFPEDLAKGFAELSATFPDYDAEARRRISERNPSASPRVARRIDRAGIDLQGCDWSISKLCRRRASADLE